MVLPKPSQILYLATYPPRECGIATFTQDLTNAIDKKFNPLIKSRILAINDNGTNIYNYNKKVAFQINETDIGDYINIAKKINRLDNIKLVNIQHEFGIFGGARGNYLVPFLEALKKPVVVTFHSILPEPDKEMHRVVQLIVERALRIVTMTNNSAEVLRIKYHIPRSKIAIIPHGIPEIDFCQPEQEKPRLGLTNRLVVSTFGMLSRDKGLQYAIRALPPVVKKYPNLLYLIIGETHPQVRKYEGEIYRNFLTKEIERLGLKNNVKFYNKYLTLEEIISYLKATDVYVLPSLNPNQAVSGTLVYALGAGRPVIATAFSHAKEIINQERGAIVPFKNSAAITRALLKFLADEKLRQTINQNAYAFTRFMTWPNVAIAYHNLFNQCIDLPQAKRAKLPPVKLNQLKHLTDNFGIVQFADHTRPDRRLGYCLDDNARALIVACQYARLYSAKPVESLKQIYFDFLKFCQRADGQFHNLVTQQRDFGDRLGSEDAQGRALLALSYFLSQPDLPSAGRREAEQIFRSTRRIVGQLKSPRAVAFTLIGLCLAQQIKPEPANLALIKQLADCLVGLYQKNSATGWQWFESSLTYSNSKLSEALYYAYSAVKEKKYLKTAETSLKFLLSIYFTGNSFAPIGQDGWYYQNGQRAYFDQQPEDAAAMVETLALAYQITQKEVYKQKAHRAFKWFLGDNALQQMIYDETTGGCHDGLGKNSLNLNEGAESTIVYLLARLTIETL